MSHHDKARQPKHTSSPDSPRSSAHESGDKEPTILMVNRGKAVKAAIDTGAAVTEKTHRPHLKRHALMTEEERELAKKGENSVSDKEMEQRALEKALGPTIYGQLSRNPDALEDALNDPDFYPVLIEMANSDDGKNVETNPEYQKVIRNRLGLPEWEDMSSREKSAQMLLRLTGYNDIIDPDYQDESEEEYDDADYDDAGFLRRKMRNAMGVISVPLTRVYGWYFDRMESHRTKFQNMSEEEKMEHKKKWGKINTAIVPLALTGLAAYVAWKSGWMDNTFGGGHQSAGAGINPHDHDAKPGNDGKTPGNVPGHDQLPQDTTDKGIQRWFEQAMDPATAPGKEHPHDFNSPLPMPHEGNQADFKSFSDSLKLQLRGNPRELADYLGKMNVPGAPHPSDYPTMDAYYNAVNKYGDEMMRNPQLHMSQFKAVSTLIDNNKEWHVLPIDRTYQSPYVMDGVVYQDDYVDYGGTVTRITLENGTTIDVRQCGQIIKMNDVVQQRVIPSSYAPRQSVQYTPGRQPAVYNAPQGSQSAPHYSQSSYTPRNTYPPSSTPYYPPSRPPVTSLTPKGPTRGVFTPQGSGNFERVPRIPAPQIFTRPNGVVENFTGRMNSGAQLPSFSIPRITGPVGNANLSNIISGMSRRP